MSDALVLNGKPWQFTSSNAADMARKGWSEQSVRSTSNSKPSAKTCLMRMRVIEKRMMAKADDDKAWDNLSRAWERHFKVWQVLAGLPGPGNRRPGPDRKLPERRVFEAQLVAKTPPPPPPPAADAAETPEPE